MPCWPRRSNAITKNNQTRTNRLATPIQLTSPITESGLVLRTGTTGTINALLLMIATPTVIATATEIGTVTGTTDDERTEITTGTGGDRALRLLPRTRRGMIARLFATSVEIRVTS